MDAALQKELFALAKTVLERLSSAPVVVLVFILLFKTHLKAILNSVSDPLGRVVESLLSRGFKLGLNKEGLKLEAEAAIAVTAQEKLPVTATGLAKIEAKEPLPAVKAESATVATGSVDDIQAKRLQALKSIDVPPIALGQENLVRADLEKLGISQQEQVDLLIKHLAVTQLLLRAENTYRSIFGSQIALLKFLNASGPCTKAQLSQFYDNAKEQFPKVYTNYSFEQYLNYLLSRGLIKQEGPPETYVIMVAGREFLKWITDAGLLENKPF